MTITDQSVAPDSGSMLGLTPLTGQALTDYINAEPINPAGLPTAYEHGNRLTPKQSASTVDPIIVEIVEGTLASVEMEVETAIARTSRSPMIRDAHDFRAGIHDRQLRKLTGRSYSALVHPIVRDFPIEEMQEGDVFFHNDVYASEGGIGHLPDMCVTVPVFADGQVVCFVQAFGHHDDIGGACPGSMPSGATSVFEEGLMIPPIKLWDAGKPNKSALAIMTRNSRMPESLSADLDAECSACLMGARRLTELFTRYGVDTVEAAFDTILDNSTEIYRREILSKIPDGQYVWEDYAEHDGVSDPMLHTQRITLTKTSTGGPDDGPRLIIDFTGTAAQAAGPINHCGDYVGGNFLKKWLAPILRNLADSPERMAELDVNEGIVPLIEMRFPEKGTLLTPEFPGPTNARTFVILRLLGVLAGVVAKAVDGQMPADQETIRYTGVYGKDRAGNDYLMREVLGGGSGGRYYSDGEDTIHVVPDSRNLPTEFTESRFPFRVERLGLSVDSGGAGRYRGGLGYEKHIRMLRDGHFMSIADRSILACWGVKGGKAGKPFQVTIDPGGPNEREIDALADDEPISAGEVVRIRTTGGGGWGDPLQRPFAEVVRDVQWGKVSIVGAEESYGVIVAEGPNGIENATVDEAASESLRARLLAERGENEPFFDRGPGYAELAGDGARAPEVDWL
ncbi:hydantoinase B/oxoprolinase family protein [Brevibacterium sp. ZH18]|uniref:hydantoinase B/oxoprolinase family protein n=1 Tax=Brevibacterium sp. ZH18 TaxID=2927784 RepID=UPI001F61ACF5|nr:hydantoinase B/oxoprolinase family protein [Brevibacterium sp. ZH18]MCI4011378.1 hydantoinase B/oxoprolinase family protein [Brevibacterium sp. ZH18]